MKHKNHPLPDLESPISYLGRGWAFPVRWGREARASSQLTPLKQNPFAIPVTGVDLSEAVHDVEQSIRVILGTRLGERVMMPDFGSRLHEYLFASIAPHTLSLISTEVRRALVRWERRIKNIDVKARAAPDDAGRIDIEIQFKLENHRTRGSLVYPFYTDHPENR